MPASTTGSGSTNTQLREAAEVTATSGTSDGGGENCLLQSGTTTLMLSTGSHLGDQPMLSGTLYFNTEGVRQFYAAVKGSVEIVWPLEVMEYGTVEFGIRDCDGYTLAFAEAGT